jgi:hypothetical protein
MVGHSTTWTEAYRVIEDIQDYNLDKPMAAASLLSDVAELIKIAKQRGATGEDDPGSGARAGKRGGGGNP